MLSTDLRPDHPLQGVSDLWNSHNPLKEAFPTYIKKLGYKEEEVGEEGKERRRRERRRRRMRRKKLVRPIYSKPTQPNKIGILMKKCRGNI